MYLTKCALIRAMLPRSVCVAETCRGRGLQSREDVIPAGTLILEAQPYAHVVCKSTHCGYCISSSQNLHRCSGCKLIKYCGTSCQRSDWVLHKAECKAFASVAPHTPSDTMRLVLRLLNRRTAHPKQWPVDQLCSHEKDLPTTVRDELALQVAGVMQLDPSMKADVVFSTCCKVLCNAFSICDHQQNSVGIGIYIPASYLNHSCDPNCVAVFDGRSLHIRSIKSIPSDMCSELLISYTEILQPCTDRQAHLRKVYCFDCKCSRCRAEELKMPPFDELYSGCGQRASAIKVEDMMTKGFHALQEIKTLATKDEWTQVKAQCLRMLEEAGALLSPMNLVIIKLKEQLLQSQLELAQWMQALAAAGSLTLPYRKYLPKHSPTLAVHYLKLAKLRRTIATTAELEQAIEDLTEGMGVMTIALGGNYVLTQQALEMLRDTKCEVAMRMTA